MKLGIADELDMVKDYKISCGNLTEFQNMTS